MTDRKPGVGCIGLGSMGFPIAARLQQAGYALTLYSRDAGRFSGPLKPLVDAGASTAPTPARLAGGVEVVLVNVTDGGAVRSVVAEGPDCVLAGASAGLVIADHSTVDPGTSKAMFSAAAGKGVGYVDAPVSGGAIGAEAGTLVTMMGGEAEAVERLAPVIGHYTAKRLHMGASGQGTVAKLCNQIAQVAAIQGVAEATAFAVSQGADADAVREVMLAGFAASRMLELEGPRMTSGDYAPGMVARLLEKDCGIALGAASDKGLSLPALDLVHGRLREACRRGWENKDVAIIYEMVKGAK